MWWTRLIWSPISIKLYWKTSKIITSWNPKTPDLTIPNLLDQISCGVSQRWQLVKFSNQKKGEWWYISYWSQVLWVIFSTEQKYYFCFLQLTVKNTCYSEKRGEKDHWIQACRMSTSQLKWRIIMSGKTAGMCEMGYRLLDLYGWWFLLRR